MPKLRHTDTRATVRASNLLVDMRELRLEVLAEHAVAGTHQERRDWERLGQVLDVLLVALQAQCGARDELGEIAIEGIAFELVVADD